MNKKLVQVFNIEFLQSEIEFAFPVRPTKEKHYINCDFSGTILNSKVEIRGKFRNCNFINCDFTSTVFQGQFENCNFSGSRFVNVNFIRPEFKRSAFSGCIFKDNSSLFSCMFFKGCDFDYAQGVEVTGPFSDSNILSVCKKTVSNGVPKFIETEKTEKVGEVYGPSPYDLYEVSGADLNRFGKTRHGRRSLGFDDDRSDTGSHRTDYILDQSAILICSKKGLV